LNSDIAAFHRLEALPSQRIPGRQVVLDRAGAGEVRTIHAERPENVPTHVPGERLARDVFDELSQGREPMVGVGPLAPGLNLEAEPAVVVGGQRRRWAITRGGPADRRPEQSVTSFASNW